MKERAVTPNRRLKIAESLEGYDKRKALTGIIVSLETGENKFHPKRVKWLTKARGQFDQLSSNS